MAVYPGFMKSSSCRHAMAVQPQISCNLNWSLHWICLCIFDDHGVLPCRRYLCPTAPWFRLHWTLILHLLIVLVLYPTSNAMSGTDAPALHIPIIWPRSAITSDEFSCPPGISETAEQCLCCVNNCTIIFTGMDTGILSIITFSVETVVNHYKRCYTF